jgi:hypothetical protein
MPVEYIVTEDTTVFRADGHGDTVLWLVLFWQITGRPSQHMYRQVKL